MAVLATRSKLSKINSTQLNKLCNNARTNPECHWTMSTPGVPNCMTAANATEHTKNAKQMLTDGQGTNKRLRKHC